MKLVYDIRYTNAKDISLSAVADEVETKTELTDGIRRAEIKVTPEYHTEKKIEDKKEVEVTVDNKEAVKTEILKALGRVPNYTVKVHECRHDEGVNTPCGNWQTVAEKGKVEEVKEVELITKEIEPVIKK